MFNFIKKTQPTSFEIRNPEAYSAYMRRENDKFVIKTSAIIVAAATAVVVGITILEKMDKSTPYAE